MKFHEWQGEYNYDSVPPLDRSSAHPDYIYGINFIILVQSKRLREYLQEQTFGHAFTCVKLYLCSISYTITLHLIPSEQLLSHEI